MESEFFIAILSGLLGAFVGSGLSHIWQKERDRNAFTMKVLSDWEASSMYATRTRAWELIRKHPNERFDSHLIYADERHNDIWAVLGYFKMLNVMVKNNLVNEDLVADGIGQVFTWWYYTSFERQLVRPIGNDWDLSAPTVAMDKWLERKCGRKRKAWKDRARREAMAFGADIPEEPTTT